MSLEIDRNELDRVKLIASGTGLSDDEMLRTAVGRGDMLLVAIVPRNLSRNSRSVQNEDSEDKEDILQIPYESMYQWQKRLIMFIRQRLGVPEDVIAISLVPTWKFWLLLVSWIVGFRIAVLHGWGAVYVLVSILLLIFLNLGKRREGELSAYSIFNDGFRRLPGQLTAEQLEAQMRRRRF